MLIGTTSMLTEWASMKIKQFSMLSDFSSMLRHLVIDKKEIFIQPVLRVPVFFYR